MEFLLVSRSITYAKQIKAALDEAGIHSKIVRTPVGVVHESCGYSIRISDRDLSSALNCLKPKSLMPKRILSQDESGSYEEVKT